MGPPNAIPELAPQGMASRQFLDFWQSIVARSGGLPRRDEVRPEDLLPIIDHVWLYERVENDFRCRIMGNHVERRWKKPVIGQRFRDLFAPAQADALISRLMVALEAGHLGFGIADAAREGWYAERTYGPLRGADGKPSFLLGVSSYIDRTVTARMKDRDIPLGLTHYYDAVTLAFVLTVSDA